MGGFFLGAVCLLLVINVSTAAETTSAGLGSLILKGLGASQAVGNTSAPSTSTRTVTEFQSANATITSAPTGTTSIPNDFGVVGNATFKTSCDYSDMGCYETCTSYANDCMTSWEVWNELLQSCTRPLSTYVYSTEIDTYIATDVSGKETVLAWTVTETESAITTVWQTSTPASGCANPSGSTLTTITSPYTVVETTAACSYVTFNFTTTLTAESPVETQTVNATYLIDHNPRFSTEYDTTSYLQTTTACQYSVPPPQCTFYAGYHANACTRGPNADACTIYGGSVQLLYWPVATAVANKTLPFKKRETTAPSVTVFEGHTLTSPSVYISFQTAFAKNELNSTIGEAHTGSILGLDLTDLSSALGNWHARSTDMTALAQGTTKVSMYAEPFSLENLNWPYAPWVWDQQQRCNDFIAQVCPVIVSGQYNPILAVPPQIRTLDPAWSSCALDLEGLYDPPMALTKATAEAVPTLPGASAAATSDAVPSPTAESPTPAPTSAGGPTLPVNTQAQSETSAAAPATAESEVVASSAASPVEQSPASSENDPSPTAQSQQASPSQNDPSPTAQSQEAASSPNSSPTGLGGLISGIASAASVAQSQTPAAESDASNNAPSVATQPAPQNSPSPVSQGGAQSQDPRPAPSQAGIASAVSIDSASNIIVGGSQTLAPGAPAVTVGGTTYQAPASGTGVIVNGETAPLPAPAETNVQTSQVQAPVTIGDQIATPASSGAYVLPGGQTLVPGGSPVSVSGHTYALASSSSMVEVDGVTSQLAAPSQNSPVMIGGQSASALSSGAYVIGSQTLAPGSSAVVVSGSTYSLAPSGSAIVINGATSAFSAVATSGGVLATPLPSGGYVLPGDHTLLPGSSDVVVSGTTYSVASSGRVVVNGVTTTLATASSSGTSTGSTTEPASDTASGQSTTTSGDSNGESGSSSSPSTTTRSSGNRSQELSWIFLIGPLLATTLYS